MGATDFIIPATIGNKKIQDYLVEITDGGLDYTFDATGNVHIFWICSLGDESLTSNNTDGRDAGRVGVLS